MLARAANAVLACTVVVLILAGPARGATAHTAYVVDGNGSAVTPIDTDTNTAGAAINLPGGAVPTGIAITPDGKTAYVASRNANTVLPIDTATNTVGTAIPVGTFPEGLAITPDGQTVYVANLNSNTVTPIDTATNTAGTPIAVGANPIAIAITPDGNTAYVANFGSNTVTPIDTATHTAGPSIPVGVGPIGIAITPDGSTVYVANENSNTVVPINTATNTAGPSIAVPNAPNQIAITPDGTTAYVVSISGTTGVTPINTATNTAGTPIAGAGFFGIAVTPDGNTAYVSNQVSNYVIPIDTATNTAGSQIGTGTSPQHIAITPDQPPVAAFTASTVKLGQATQLDASSSSDSTGAIASYQWSFGDGTTATTSSPTVSHTYSSAGQYAATVTETDGSGCSTSIVFTGQTVSCNGSTVAQAARQVTVSPLAAPTTTVALSPGSPNGSGGWYTTPVSVSISASDPDDAVAQTRCALDPATPPASFDELPASACSLTGVSADGQHTVYVASKDAGGDVEAVHSVTVKIDTTPPTVAITSPAQGATFTLGHAAITSFTCAESAAGPGISSCLDGLSRASGARLDTRALGSHTLTVTATSISGLTRTTSISYKVVRPSNRFKLSHVHISANGRMHFEVTLPGPGHIDVLETAWKFNEAHAATVLLQPATGRFVFSRAHLKATSAKTIHVTVKPNARGNRLVRHHLGRRLRIRLWVTFQPASGLPRSVGMYAILIPGA